MIHKLPLLRSRRCLGLSTLPRINNWGPPRCAEAWRFARLVPHTSWGAPFLGLVTLVSLWLSRVWGLRVFLTVGLPRGLSICAFLLSLTRVISMWEF